MGKAGHFVAGRGALADERPERGGAERARPSATGNGVAWRACRRRDVGKRGSFLGHRFIEVEDQIGHGRVSGQLRRVEPRVTRRFANVQQAFGRRGPRAKRA